MDVRVKAHRIDSNSEFSQHRLISKCPDKWPDPILRSECEDTGPINARVLRRDITLEQLSQNWPVASNRTSVFYKNRACASCHGDAEEGSLIFWKLKLSYEDFPELGPSAEPRVLLEAFLKDSSTEVSFTVPDGMDARPCQFVLVKHSDIIGKCNMTGFRYLYDPVLWKSCELFPTLFKVFGDYFANMFCYWCQYDDKMPASSTCYSGIPFPFFVILSPDAVQSIHDARQNFDCRCRDGFLYDPYKVGKRLSKNTLFHVLLLHSFKLSTFCVKKAYLVSYYQDPFVSALSESHDNKNDASPHMVAQASLINNNREFSESFQFVNYKNKREL